MYDLSEDSNIYSIQELKEYYEAEKTKLYEKPYENIYIEYKRFITNDMAAFIYQLIKEQKFEIGGKAFQIVVKGSLFENVRIKWLENYFRNNNIGTISHVGLITNDNRNADVKYSLRSRFNISIAPNVNLEKLLDVLNYEIPSLDKLKADLKRKPAELIKEELELQRKNSMLTEEMKKNLRFVFPNAAVDSNLVPYKMFYLIVNELKIKNYLNSVDQENITIEGLKLLEKMHFSIDSISLFTGIPVIDIENVLNNKGIRR